MSHDSAVAHDRAAGAPANEIEITPETPAEYLASELYRKSELLFPESGTPWAELSEREQRFYRLLVDHLLAFSDVVRAALDCKIPWGCQNENDLNSSRSCDSRLNGDD